MTTTTAAYAYNGPTRPWPSYSDVKLWVYAAGGVSGSDAGNDDAEILQWCLDAAIERMAQTTELDVYKRSTDPVTVDGVTSYPTIEPKVLGEVPPVVYQATIMQTARWFDRRDTINGLAGGAEFGGVVRTSSLDPDIKDMIANYVVWGLA